MNETPKPKAGLSFAGRLAGIAVAALAGGTQQLAAAGMEVLPGTLITSLDYTDPAGSTIGALNDIAGSFSGLYMGGPDVFYSFEVLTSGTMSFTVTPGPGYDTGIGLFQGSLASPTWLFGVDDTFTGPIEGIETFSYAVTAGQTYHFVVDSFYGGPLVENDTRRQGTYTLDVQGQDGVTLVVPEPGAAMMLALGAAALGWRRRRAR